MTLGIVIILLANVTGLICIKQIRPVTFALVPLLLFITTINELLIIYVIPLKSKTLFYNVYSLLEIIIWSSIFLFEQAKKYRIITFTFGALILIFSIFEICLKNGFHSITYRLFSLYLIVNIFIFFSGLINLKTQHILLRDGKFWIYFGLLLFHFVFIFYLSALDFKEFRADKAAILAFRGIINLVNILYYISISIGLLCLSFFRQ